jgi:uncharacterized damage-inducible protein DinB
MHGTQETLLAVARFRSATREQVVGFLRQVDADVIRSPAAIAGGNGDGSIYAALLHLVDVEESWLHEGLLAEGWQDGPDADRFASFDAIVAIWAQTSADWISYLTDHDDSSLWAPFTNRRGERIPSWLIAWHAFNHTTHHLAEIWTALTGAGFSPPELDPLRWASEQPWSFPLEERAGLYPGAKRAGSPGEPRPASHLAANIPPRRRWCS